MYLHPGGPMQSEPALFCWRRVRYYITAFVGGGLALGYDPIRALFGRTSFSICFWTSRPSPDSKKCHP